MPRYFCAFFLFPLSLSALPLRFELNQGHYTARGVTLTAEGPVFAAGVRMTLPGARWAAPVPGGPPVAYTNYFVARSSKRVLQYESVRYRGIYQGVDLVFHGSSAGLEYDFFLAPGADPHILHLRFPNASRIAIEAGDLLVDSQRHHRPPRLPADPERKALRRSQLPPARRHSHLRSRPIRPPPALSHRPHPHLRHLRRRV